MRLQSLGLVIVLAALAACGSSSRVTKPVEAAAVIGAVKFRVAAINDTSGEAVPSHIVGALRGHLDSELSKRNLLAG